MNVNDLQVHSYLVKEFHGIIGKTVRGFRLLSDEEVENMGWYRGSDPAWAVVFTDGSLFVPSADPEGNGPGWGFVFTPDEKDGA